ncbi:MAG: translation initiation factor IF-3, partial [Candidatus Parcubacteria bacterium]|nr:translation initiation factor IF-3 [Candidatus Parcubacteria bacterium]
MEERINTQIRAPQLRVIGPDGSPLGVISRDEALTRA